MVPFNLIYYRPETIPEALELYRKLQREDRNPAFYGGGTEILTRTRVQDADFDAVIDLKNIPDLQVHDDVQGEWRFGAGLRLTDLSEKNLWPLLSATADRVADHTARGQITLGGNLLSVLPYREAILPFLIEDSAQAQVATRSGVQTRPFADLFDQTLKVKPGEFLVALNVDGPKAQAATYRSHKMTRLDWIDYPLVTIALARRPDGRIRAAFSGWTSYPFSSARVDKILSDHRLSAQDRAEQAVRNMPARAMTDVLGTREYREFVTQYTLADMLNELEEMG